MNQILRRSVDRGERRRMLRGISHVSVDEKAIHRGHKYATVVSDSERGVVLDVGQGRDQNSVTALLQGLLGDLKDEIRPLRPICGRPIFLAPPSCFRMRR